MSHSALTQHQDSVHCPGDFTITLMRFYTIALSSFPLPPSSARPSQCKLAVPRFSRRFVAAVLLVAPTAVDIEPAKADITSRRQGMVARNDLLDNSADLSLGSSDVDSTSDEAAMSIAGRWRKDKDLSDMQGYGRQLDLLGIGGVKKRAATILMDGVDIQQDAKGFTTSFITKIRFFRPVESFSFTEPTQMPRRDQREGSQTAVVTPVSKSRLEVNVTWDEPMQGGVKEVYTLPEPGVLHIHSVTTVGDKSESTLQIYRKRD